MRLKFEKLPPEKIPGRGKNGREELASDDLGDVDLGQIVDRMRNQYRPATNSLGMTEFAEPAAQPGDPGYQRLDPAPMQIAEPGYRRPEIADPRPAEPALRRPAAGPPLSNGVERQESRPENRGASFGLRTRS